jgi:hypothetical protein
MMVSNDNPIILDIEASGFGNGSYPIEIGFALPDKNTHCYLVKPMDDWTHWNLGAEEVHGISRDILLEKGRPVNEVAEQLNLYLGNKTVYSDGWGYDMGWISLLFDAADINMNFQIETLYALLHDDQLVLWENMRRNVIKDLGVQRHRASSDARIIQETYIRTRNKLREQST